MILTSGELASELGISSQPWLSEAYLSPLMALGYIAQTLPKELSEFTNVDEARRAFGRAAKSLALGDGTWKAVFDAYWQHYVTARIPAQAFDKMNENFFRTTFTSRCLDVLPMFYSFETEYNSSEGRCDFLAIPKPGVAKPAQLVEFKYFTNAATEKGKVPGRSEPDAETVEQALVYRKALAHRPDWNHEIAVTVVEVCGSTGCNWFDLAKP